jgi:hypothetical protein
VKLKGRLKNYVLAQGQTQGSTLQQCTNKTLTIDPFDNTCEADAVSHKVEVGGGYRTQVFVTKMGHRYVIITLHRVLRSNTH